MQLNCGALSLYDTLIISTDASAPRYRFQIADVNFRSQQDVAEIVVRLHQELFPGMPYEYILRRYEAVEAMFNGNYEGFQPMDTAYHDIEHTLQTSLCLTRLLVNRQHCGAKPLMTENDFNTALIAILLHDMGYLKEMNDVDGTGAKYTHVHETRSCRHAREYLKNRDWDDGAIEAVEHLISCTGPRANLASIPFDSDIEKILGQAVCTADFIGQISDPGYVEKLPALFKEFTESFDFQGIPPEEWPYSSSQDMLTKTPVFYEKFVVPHMEDDCGNVWQYFADPETGENPYLDSVNANIERIRRMTMQDAR